MDPNCSDPFSWDAPKKVRSPHVQILQASDIAASRPESLEPGADSLSGTLNHKPKNVKP